MTLEKAIERIRREMDGAGEVMRTNRENGDNWHFDSGRQHGLKEALEILAEVGHGSGLDEALNRGDGSYRP